MDFQKVVYGMASRLNDSKALEEWAVTYGLRDDAFIKQLILDLKWKELQLELEIPDIPRHTPANQPSTRAQWSSIQKRRRRQPVPGVHTGTD